MASSKLSSVNHEFCRIIGGDLGTVVSAAQPGF
jgi:hypothetical protein